MSTIDKIFGFSLILLSLLAWAVMGEAPGAHPLRSQCGPVEHSVTGAGCVVVTVKSPDGVWREEPLKVLPTP